MRSLSAIQNVQWNLFFGTSLKEEKKSDLLSCLTRVSIFLWAIVLIWIV